MMKEISTRTEAVSVGVLALAASMLLFGLILAPKSADAFWWPWGDHHAYAQGEEHHSDKESTSTVAVTIEKYIDGAPATDESADGNAFPMTASWDDPDGIGTGSGNYELSSPSYKATTTDMEAGADYSTEEVLDGDVVSASCDSDNPYALVGYSMGTSTQVAAEAEIATDTPSFTDLSTDQYIIVWNETCDNDGNATSTATSTGSIDGEVTGGASEENPGDLMVTSIDAQKTTAVANGEFADGWQYVFNITVPTDESNLAMKFADWMQNGGTHTIPVANNMRISSDQADNGGATVTLSAADTYSSPALHMTGDLDSGEDGLQVQVLVEVAVPSDTYNGTYSTTYGVQTLP